MQEKIETLGEFPEFAGFFFARVEPEGGVDGEMVPAAVEALSGVEPFEAAEIEATLRGLAERLGLKPRDAFQPIRLAVTGSKVSPGLFESLELLGREESLARLAGTVEAARADRARAERETRRVSERSVSAEACLPRSLSFLSDKTAEVGKRIRRCP